MNVKRLNVQFSTSNIQRSTSNVQVFDPESQIPPFNEAPTLDRYYFDQSTDPRLEVVSELCKQGWSAVVVGDTKTPADWSCPGVDFLSVEKQKQLFGAYADLIPYRHYCRKNLGYLYAMSHGAAPHCRYRRR